jgi:hypothetical protein
VPHPLRLERTRIRRVWLLSDYPLLEVSPTIDGAGWVVRASTFMRIPFYDRQHDSVNAWLRDRGLSLAVFPTRGALLEVLAEAIRDSPPGAKKLLLICAMWQQTFSATDTERRA